MSTSTPSGSNAALPSASSPSASSPSASSPSASSPPASSPDASPVGALGFIGLGVMGEPMCRHLIARSGLPVIAFDRDPAPLARMAALGARDARDAAEAMRAVGERGVVFLSLPSGDVVREVALGDGGLLAAARAGQTVVDLSTSPVALTRDLAKRFAERGVNFVDAPVARTRAAAEAGALSVMVGADPAIFQRLHPLIACFATDITSCGPVGCGQVVKILNNMVLFQTVSALAEAKTIGMRAGVDPTLLFDTLSKGSADSFALRNHGIKAMLPEDFPPRAFSTAYARKDLSYALALAADTGVDAAGARLVDERFAASIQAGDQERYFPVIERLIAGRPTAEPLTSASPSGSTTPSTPGSTAPSTSLNSPSTSLNSRVPEEPKP